MEIAAVTKFSCMLLMLWYTLVIVLLIWIIHGTLKTTLRSVLSFPKLDLQHLTNGDKYSFIPGTVFSIAAYLEVSALIS